MNRRSMRNLGVSMILILCPLCEHPNCANLGAAAGWMTLAATMPPTVHFTTGNKNKLAEVHVHLLDLLMPRAFERRVEAA